MKLDHLAKIRITASFNGQHSSSLQISQTQIRNGTAVGVGGTSAGTTGGAAARDGARAAPATSATAGVAGVVVGVGGLPGILCAPVAIPVITVRALLVEAEKDLVKARGSLWAGPREAYGYGLYSYILFASHPGPARYDEYRALIKEYLGMLGDVEDYRNLSRKDLNVTYLPIAPKRVRIQKELLEDWILENYGYQRAIQLLQKVGMQTPDGGPYIVSSLIPLAQTSEKPLLVFYQDLAGVPSGLMALYFRLYENEMRNPPSWTTRTLNTLALRLRTVISQFARETTTALPPLGDVLHVVRVSTSHTEEITAAPTTQPPAPTTQTAGTSAAGGERRAR